MTSKETRNIVESLACRGCLATDCKLYSILDVRLLEPYEDLIGYPLGSSDVYPKYLCMYCRSMLLNFLSFRMKCRTVLMVLKEAQDAGYTLTTGYVRSIDRNYYKLSSNYTKTKTDIIEFGHEENNSNTIAFVNNVSKLNSAINITYEKNATSIAEFVDYDVMDDRTQQHLDDIGTNKIVNHDKMLQDDAEDSNRNEEWLNEYLDIDSDSNMEVNDSAIKNSVNYKNVSDNQKNYCDTDRKGSAINDIRVAKTPSVMSKNDTAADSNYTIDKKDSTIRNNPSIDNSSDSEDDMKESDSDIDDLINLFLKPTNYIKIVTKIRNTNNENSNIQANVKMNNVISDRTVNTAETNGSILEMLRKRKESDPKAHDEIPKKRANIVNVGLDQRNNRLEVRAEKLDFNVKFFTKYEKYNEIERRRNDTIKPPYTTKCEMCGEDFETEAFKENHYEKFHNPSAPYTCQICQYRFQSKVSLAIHLRIHKYEFTCKNCKYVTRNKNKMADHYRKMHKRKDAPTQVCAYCGVVYRKNTWYTHMKSKHPTELLSCEICSASLFFNSIDLKKHYDHAHKDVEEVNCDCNNTFLNQKAFSKHQASSRCDLYPCKFCGVNLATEKQLQYHLLKHRMQCDMSEDYFNECGGCKVLFQTAEALETHVEECLEGGLPCVHCGESYTTNDWLNKHMLDKHILEESSFDIKNIKMAEIMCEVCGKCFKSPRLLKQHQLVHSGRALVRRRPRTRACLICSKMFVSNNRLQLHMRVHTGERPHRCEHCPKTFKWQTGLAKHKKWHHIENAKVCPVCGKTFRKEISLEKHVKRHMKKQHSETEGKKERERLNEEVNLQYDMIEYDDGCEYLVLADDCSTEYEDKGTT